MNEMIEKIKDASTVLLVIAVVDGLVNIAEWLGGFDLFVAASTLGLLLLLIAMLMDKKTNFGRIAQGFFAAGLAYIHQLHTSLCGGGSKDEDTQAVADAIVADATAEDEHRRCKT